MPALTSQQQQIQLQHQQPSGPEDHPPPAPALPPASVVAYDGQESSCQSCELSSSSGSQSSQQQPQQQPQHQPHQHPQTMFSPPSVAEDLSQQLQFQQQQQLFYAPQLVGGPPAGTMSSSVLLPPQLQVSQRSSVTAMKLMGSACFTAILVSGVQLRVQLRLLVHSRCDCAGEYYERACKRKAQYFLDASIQHTSMVCFGRQ